MDISPREALEELARRKLAKSRDEAKIGAILGELFPKQLAFLQDPSRNKALLCTRRAGKTEVWSRYSTRECLIRPGAKVRIWGSSRQRCKALMWDAVTSLCARHQIPIATNETDLIVKFENGSEIQFLGAPTYKVADTKRGEKTCLEVVLECQNFLPNFLQQIVDDVIEPSTIDNQGTICLEGTPGYVSAGYWFAITGDEYPDSVGNWESKGIQQKMVDHTYQQGQGWSVHAWSLLDNPHLPHAHEELARIKSRRGWADDHPTLLREYRRKWVKDSSSMYYRWDSVRNTYDPRSVDFSRPGWKFVLGWDIGFNDANALVLWAWREDDPVMYEAESWTKNETTSADVHRVYLEWASRYEIGEKVADTGGGGKLAVEEYSKRYNIRFEPAQKTSKWHFVSLLNDMFIAGRVKTIPGSDYSNTVAQLPKDPDWNPASGKPPSEHPAFPNHTSDAGLYSWRKCYNYRYEAEPPAPQPGTDEYEDEMRTTFEKLWYEHEHEPTDEGYAYG